MTSEFITVKLLGRSSEKQVKRELSINKFLREECQSRCICTIKDSFTIHHHLAETDPQYKGIIFDDIAYPLAGIDFQRIHILSACENSQAPPSLERRVQCIWGIIQGVAELHSLGIVHAGDSIVSNSLWNKLTKHRSPSSTCN
jgi:hypothetical protein